MLIFCTSIRPGTAVSESAVAAKGADGLTVILSMRYSKISDARFPKVIAGPIQAPVRTFTEWLEWNIAGEKLLRPLIQKRH